MAQVKFYYKGSMPSTEIDEGGVYFIQGGELYRGAQRFGLGRVTVAESTTGIKDAARGDIVVTGSGAGWVYVGSGEGEGWKSIGDDVSDIHALVSSMTSGLSKGNSGSYITHIEQDANGNVTANAVAFPTLATGDADGQVKLNGVNATVSGWAGLVSDVEANAASISTLGTKVSTLEGKVSGIEGIIDVSNSKVTATTGSFTNLTVSDTATFSATVVSAGSLTVGGSTVEQLADKQIAAIASVTQTGASNGVTVSVTTSGGSVTAVSVDASAFGNVMKFRGVVASTGAITDPASGDIVVIGSEPATGFVSGQEWICTAAATTDPVASATWELIGDQNTYAVNAYSSTAAVYSGVKTVPGALNAAGAAIDAINTNKAQVGSNTTAATHGVSATVTLASNAAPTIGITVDAITASTGVAAGVDKVVTAGAVADYVTSKVAYVPTQEEIVTASTTTLDGAMHAVAGAVDALKTKTDKYSAGTSTGSWTADGASKAAISTTVSIDADTMAPSVTMAVNVAELQSALGLKAAAYRDVSNTVSDTTSTALVTEGAVATALAWITD